MGFVDHFRMIMGWWSVSTSSVLVVCFTDEHLYQLVASNESLTKLVMTDESLTVC